MFGISELIITVLTALTAEGLVFFAYPRLFRRQKRAETRQKENDADAVKVDTQSKMIDDLQEENQKYREEVARLSGVIDENRNEILKLDSDLRHERDRRSQAATGLCLHISCPLRRPDYGKGDKYIKDRIDDETLGFDYDSLVKCIITQHPNPKELLKELKAAIAELENKE